MGPNKNNYVQHDESSRVSLVYKFDLNTEYPTGFRLVRTQVNVLSRGREISQRRSVSVQQGGQHHHGPQRGQQAQEQGRGPQQVQRPGLGPVQQGPNLREVRPAPGHPEHQQRDPRRELHHLQLRRQHGAAGAGRPAPASRLSLLQVRPAAAVQQLSYFCFVRDKSFSFGSRY